MAVGKKKFRLYDLALDRVDLVRAGSNPKADIVLFKSADHQEEDDMPAPKKKAPAKKVAAKKPDTRTKSKQKGKADEDEEEEDDAVNKNLDDDDEDEEESEEEDVEKSEDDEDEDDGDESEDDEDEDDEPVKKGSKDKGKDKSKDKGKKPAKKPAKKAAASDDEDDDDSDDSEDDEIDETIMKSLPVAVQKQLERNNRIVKQARASARRAEQTATIEKQKRESLEFIEKAKSTLPNLPGTDEEKGEVLQALASGTVEKHVASKIRKMLKAGDAAMRDLLMSEDGRRREIDENDGSAQAELVAKAKALVKADPTLTMQQAQFQASSADPALYNRVRKERQARTH